MIRSDVMTMLLGLTLASAGCAGPGGAGAAGSSGAASADEDRQVAAQPPPAGQDRAEPLPDEPEVSMGKAHVPAEQVPADQAPADQAPAAQAQPSAAPQNASKDPPQTLSPTKLDAFIDKGPSFALQMVRVQPARTKGRFDGFEIVDMRRPARRAMAPQIVNGDVITHINGVRIKKPDDYLNAWKLLNEVSTIRIDYLRDGHAHHATWRVQPAK